MIPGFGKDQISLGSAPDNDVVLQGPGVAPRHARIVKQNGALVFLDGGASQSFANGAPVAPKAAAAINPAMPPPETSSRCRPAATMRSWRVIVTWSGASGMRAT